MVKAIREMIGEITMKDLNKMNREDIFMTELIGEGLPDLETEIAKIQNQSPTEQDDFGFGGFDNGDDSDIFGFGQKRKSDEDED